MKDFPVIELIVLIVNAEFVKQDKNISGFYVVQDVLIAKAYAEIKIRPKEEVIDGLKQCVSLCPALKSALEQMGGIIHQITTI